MEEAIHSDSFYISPKICKIDGGKMIRKSRRVGYTEFRIMVTSE